MAERTPRYSMGEFEKRGKQLYAQNVLPSVTPNDSGKFAAIDIETGMFELDGDDYRASERLFARNPDAQIWLERVGCPTAYQICEMANRSELCLH